MSGQHVLAVRQDGACVSVREAGQEVLHDQRVHAGLAHGIREGLAHISSHKAQALRRIVHALGLKGAREVHAAAHKVAHEPTYTA